MEMKISNDEEIFKALKIAQLFEDIVKNMNERFRYNCLGNMVLD